MDNSLEVTIYERTLNIKCSEENIEYLKEIANFVTSKELSILITYYIFS